MYCQRFSVLLIDSMMKYGRIIILYQNLLAKSLLGSTRNSWGKFCIFMTKDMSVRVEHGCDFASNCMIFSTFLLKRGLNSKLGF